MRVVLSFIVSDHLIEARLFSIISKNVTQPRYRTKYVQIKMG